MMPKSLGWVIALCALTVLLHVPVNAQTQKRNFNLNCGLIGSFARYPQHVQGCKAVVLCTDPKTCLRKLAPRQKKLEVFVSQEESATGEPPEGDAATELSVSVSVQGNVSAGSISADGGVNAGAAADSNGGASGSASGGAGAGGANAGTGGGLGVGGL